MPTYEGLRLKLLKWRRLTFAKRRRKSIENPNFTIISNNCWGGMIYESYDLPKESPTIGLFFMASDYIKFLSDLKGYFSAELKFIDPADSRWKEQVSTDKRFGHYPVGILDNGKESIEIFFLHYRSEQEAKEKWKRRTGRINWDRMLVKFNDQNDCNKEDVVNFLKLPYKNKLFFTCKKWPELIGGGTANVRPGHSCIVDETVFCFIRQLPPCDFVRASYEPFGRNRYIDLDKTINSL